MKTGENGKDGEDAKEVRERGEKQLLGRERSSSVKTGPSFDKFSYHSRADLSPRRASGSDAASAPVGILTNPPDFSACCRCSCPGAARAPFAPTATFIPHAFAPHFPFSFFPFSSHAYFLFGARLIRLLHVLLLAARKIRTRRDPARLPRMHENRTLLLRCRRPLGSA
ncbi:hypothetical protein HPB48_012411 [Haemaphysalis longicornis]|uniref:Uncharacterized protein n=1 Tax=Haemaphysalis longicornis TaxID=44386 RepID=A0A9J6FRA6_HAELO|nr:hypothetical protein HPB48_012411 [Haemaphysalis longicornis]